MYPKPGRVLRTWTPLNCRCGILRHPKWRLGESRTGPALDKLEGGGSKGPDNRVARFEARQFAPPSDLNREGNQEALVRACRRTGCVAASPPPPPSSRKTERVRVAKAGAASIDPSLCRRGRRRYVQRRKKTYRDRPARCASAVGCRECVPQGLKELHGDVHAPTPASEPV